MCFKRSRVFSGGREFGGACSLPPGLVSVYTWRRDLVMCLQSIFDEGDAPRLLSVDVLVHLYVCTAVCYAPTRVAWGSLPLLLLL